MTSIGRTRLVWGLLAAFVGAVGTARCEEKPAQAPQGVVIGMPDSLFQGIPAFLKHAGAKPFLKLMKDSTGVDGAISFEPDCLTLANKMKDGKIHLGVFQGHEFAWARAKHPDLVPIAVASPMQPVQAFCLISWDCKAKNVGDLADQKISLPPIHRDYCDLFLAKQRAQHMQGKNFEGQLKAATASDAIFDVIDGKCSCTVVDCSTLKFFQTVNPGPFKNIKVLSQSEVFPNACIAIKKGEMDEKTIEKFRSALLNAENLPGGRPMLATWKLNGFVKVPDDYEKQVQNIHKAYPAPRVGAPEK